MGNIDFAQALPIIINLISILGGGLYALAKVEAKLSILSSANQAFIDRISKIEGKLDQLGTAFIQFAKQETRLDNLDKRANELIERMDEINNRVQDIYANRIVAPKTRKR